MERNRRGRPRHPDVLTPAEWRVLEALRDGGTNADIAARLGLSADTVKYHISNMLAKLELRDRRALASWRPEERRGRLGALPLVPAAVWSMARPIAWVGAGTAAVAGVVAGAVAVVALVAVVLVTAGGDADPPLAVAPPPETSTPAPTQTPKSTSTPAPIPTAQPSPTAPTPTQAPTRVPTATVTPTPVAIPVLAAAVPPTREELGIREVDTAEVLAAAGLTHVRYDAGEEVPWDPGLFLLDVESGTVEGWVHALTALPDEERPTGLLAGDELDVSPSNRFISWSGRRVLYDRVTDRAYTSDALIFSLWWGTGEDERLVFWVPSLDAHVMLDGDLQPLVQFQLPSGERFTSSSGSYILVQDERSIETFYLVNFANEANPRVHTWVLPWELTRNREAQPRYRIELLDNLIAFIGREGDDACRVTRYDLDSVLLSDRRVPCGETNSLPRISPDGSLIAATTLGGVLHHDYARGVVGAVLSIFEAATGVEVLRLLGVNPSWIESGYGSVGSVWLAGSSGIIVDTSVGRRVAGLDAAWRPAPGWASPADPDLFLEYAGAYAPWSAAAIDKQGDVRASLSYGPPSAPIPRPFDPPPGLSVVAGWGAGDDAIRVWTWYFFAQAWYEYYYPPPPLTAVIERPPFDSRLLVEIVVDTCLNVREEPSRAAPMVTCIPPGTVVETDDFTQFEDSSQPEQDGTWMPIRTDDGVEGWAHADYLRWHSDGVRLEE